MPFGVTVSPLVAVVEIPFAVVGGSVPVVAAAAPVAESPALAELSLVRVAQAADARASISAAPESCLTIPDSLAVVKAAPDSGTSGQ
jgi:hypothetical protein